MKTLIFLFGLFLLFGNTLGCIASISGYLQQRVKEKGSFLQALFFAFNIFGAFVGACILRGYIK